MLREFVLPFEILSFLVSLLMYRRKSIPQYLRLFPIFLFLTCVFEIATIPSGDDNLITMPLHNFFTVSEFLFYFYVLYNMITKNVVKKVILISSVIYPIIAVWYILLQDVYLFHGLTFMIGAVLTVCLCIYHLYELFNVPNLRATLISPTFWLCIGLLSFYGGIAPLFGAWNWLPSNTFNLQIVDLVIAVLNYILYSSFMAAFFCFLKTSRPAEDVPGTPRS